MFSKIKKKLNRAEKVIDSLIYPKDKFTCLVLATYSLSFCTEDSLWSKLP